MISKSAEERFLQNISVNSSNGCWEWTAGREKTGYGFFTVRSRKFRAHRFSYEMHKGEIPEGLLVCHSCDNPSCVNPDHLWVGTQKDNMEDKVRKGRSSFGELNGAAKYSAHQVRFIRRTISIYGRKYGLNKKLGSRLNIKPCYIGEIARGLVWKKVNA